MSEDKRDNVFRISDYRKKPDLPDLPRSIETFEPAPPNWAGSLVRTRSLMTGYVVGKVPHTNQLVVDIIGIGRRSFWPHDLHVLRQIK